MDINRDDRFDFLRGIGLICIILAHIDPPTLFHQLRNFDVPLIVLVAGSVFTISEAGKHQIGYGKYLVGRLIRLVVPTWIFLTFFFLIEILISSLLQQPYPFSEAKIISSFLLMKGIGYVWIIRVLLFISLIAPLIAKSSSSESTLAYIFAFVVYVAYEIMVRTLPEPSEPMLKGFMDDFLYTLLPYGCIFFLGTRLHTLDEKTLLRLATIAFLIFAAISIDLYATEGRFVKTQAYKYPPTIYYFSYAIAVSSILYRLVKSSTFPTIPGRAQIALLGRSSIWVYFWHIQILYLTKQIGLKAGFGLKFLLIFSISVSIAMVQRHAIEKLLPFIKNQSSKRLVRIIFTG
ncbi:Acyl_transf_3 domain-containing protein [Gammaproteobacteria bacterium]